MAIIGPKQIAALVEAARQGDRAAFEELVRQFQDAVAGIVIARLGPGQDAEDVMQESFLAAYTQLGDFADPANFGPWVCGIARNLALRWLRDQRRGTELPADVPAPSKAQPSDESDTVLKAVERLPAHLGESVMLFYIDGYTTKEVAGLLRVPPGTIRRRLHEARKRLRNYLEKAMVSEIRRKAPEPVFAEKVMRFTRFTERVRIVTTLASRVAERLQENHIGCDLLVAMLEEKTTAKLLSEVGLDVGKTRRELQKLMKAGSGTPAQGKLPQTPGARKAVNEAIEEAQTRHHPYVDIEHLLWALCQRTEEPIAQLLTGLGAEMDSVCERVSGLLDAKPETQLGGEKAVPEGLGLKHREKASGTEADPDPLPSLLRQEIPEIAKGLVQVQRIVRMPGLRAKVAVESSSPSVDAVEACVGPEGRRIKRIADALAGEKIDVVHWQSSVERLVANALCPADVGEIIPCPALQLVTVVVPADELPKAIGDEGVNVRLAAKLVGWDLDLVTSAQVETEWNQLTGVIADILGPADKQTNRLRKLGVISPTSAFIFGADSLAEALGIDRHSAGRIAVLCSEIPTK